MQILLKWLTLTNFKGARNVTINFDQITNIYADNKIGKTTIFDAYYWLLFGKDSTGRSTFEIKTLDADNKPIPKLDHEVAGGFVMNGDPITLRRCYRENWVKKKGNPVLQFDGHETVYFWDEVPMPAGEYQKKIAGLIDETIFKLISNLTFYNSLKWQERRKILQGIAGQLPDREILQNLITGGKANFQPLLDALTGTKTVEEYARTIVAKKKTISDELKLLPSRIDEANRSLPDPCDYDAVYKLLQGAIGRLDIVKDQLVNKTGAAQEHQRMINGKISEVGELGKKKLQIQFDIKNLYADKRSQRDQAIADKQRELTTANNELNRLITEVANEQGRQKQLMASAQTLRDQWQIENAKTLNFNDGDFKCPTCLRMFEADSISAKKTELTNNFNTEKSRILGDITNRGSALATQIKDIETKIANITADGTTARAKAELLSDAVKQLLQENARLLDDEAQAINTAIQTDAGIIQIDKDIAALNVIINTPAPGEDNSGLLLQQREIETEITGYRQQLNTKEQRDKIQARITELSSQEADMANELASFEGIEFAIEQFTTEKMNALEANVNERFGYVKFKMFEDQINGGRDECCETLIDGVPYTDTNNASRINAGLDIINVLSDHYGVSAPVFVDNAESVNTLIPLSSQLIRLVVSLDKKLRIESSK